MLLQAIVIDDRAYEVEKAGRSFINTYIFPGGCLPSMEVDLAHGRARHRPAPGRTSRTSPRTTRRTLAHWRERFLEAAEAARASSATTSASAGCGSCI